MEIAKVNTCPGTSNCYNLSKENFICPKEQIMHIEFSLALNVLKQYAFINSFETRMKPDMN